MFVFKCWKGYKIIMVGLSKAFQSPKCLWMWIWTYQSVCSTITLLQDHIWSIKENPRNVHSINVCSWWKTEEGTASLSSLCSRDIASPAVTTAMWSPPGPRLPAHPQTDAVLWRLCWIPGIFPGCIGAVPHCPKWQCLHISGQPFSAQLPKRYLEHVFCPVYREWHHTAPYSLWMEEVWRYNLLLNAGCSFHLLFLSCSSTKLLGRLTHILKFTV